MQVIDEAHSLSAGQALRNPSDDRLDYSQFAKVLAHSLLKMLPREGMVIAIYGDWGTGKTTMLNFVEFYLEQEPNAPILVRFNPWWFSGRKDLTMHLFGQLRTALGMSDLADTVRNLLIDRIGDFAKLISIAPLPYASTAAKILTTLHLRKQEPDIVHTKCQIEKVLSNQDRKIVILIDDIDRLTAEEIRQIFGVIKSIADFPNVVYLLAFDKNIAVKALEQMQGLKGEDYLEKIVQVPFELPALDKKSLKAMLYEQLDAILSQVPNNSVEPVYWGNLYDGGIDHFISNPRHIVRLANTLRVTFPAVSGEVNPSDFIAIETLRVFCPLAYDVVRKNADEFTGYRSRLRGPDGREYSRHFHESWMKHIQEEDMPAVKSLLTRLFPKFQSAWENIDYPASWELTWRKKLRVCSLATFPVYFRFALPEGAVSLAEVRAVLSIASNREAFGSKLLNLAGQKRSDGKTRVSALLDRLADYPEEFKPESIPSVVQTLFEIGDRLLLPEDDSHDFLGLRNYMRISRLAEYLLLRLDEEHRYGVLRQSMELGHSIATIVDFVIVLELQHGRRNTTPLPEDARLVISEHLSELEMLVLKKLRDTASEGKLVDAPRLKMILDYWREWNVDEVRVWIDSLVTNKDALASLIDDSFLQGYSQSISDKVGEVTYRLDSSLHELLDGEETIGHVRELLESGRWTGEKELAVERFVQDTEERSSKKN